MTYGEILTEFFEDNRNINIADYRPCNEFYGYPNIVGGIIIWLENGTEIVYIAKCCRKQNITEKKEELNE